MKMINSLIHSSIKQLFMRKNTPLLLIIIVVSLVRVLLVGVKC